MTSETLARTNAPEVSNVPARLSSVPDNFALIPVVEANRALLSAKLPHGYTLEGMLVELYFAAQKQQDLLRVDPRDLVPALVDALDTGGTIGKDVYLLTFKSSKKETPDVAVALNYQFKAELVVRAGGARSIDAQPVYANEPFQMELGSSPFIRHQPLSASKRGALIGAYAIAQLGHGVVKVQWCDQESIETLRARSRSWSNEALGRMRQPLVCPEWYGPKTAVHRLVKLLPKNPKLTRLLGRIEQEDQMEFGDDPDQIATVEPAVAHAPVPSTNSFDLAGVDVDVDEEQAEQIVMTLVEASAVKVQGRELGTFRNTQLDKIEQTARTLVEKEGDDSEYVRLLVAIGVLREGRKSGKAFEPSAKATA